MSTDSESYNTVFVNKLNSQRTSTFKNNSINFISTKYCTISFKLFSITDRMRNNVQDYLSSTI